MYMAGNNLLNSCQNEKLLFYVQHSPRLFPRPAENRALHEIMWKNMVELDRPNMVTQHSAKRCDLHAG